MPDEVKEMLTESSALEIAEVVKRITEQKQRQAAANAAAQRARNAILKRQQFTPKQIGPKKPVSFNM